MLFARIAENNYPRMIIMNRCNKKMALSEGHFNFIFSVA